MCMTSARLVLVTQLCNLTLDVTLFSAVSLPSACSDVDCLGRLKSLRNFSLQGNRVCDSPDYAEKVRLVLKFSDFTAGYYHYSVVCCRAYTDCRSPKNWGSAS